MDNIRNVSEPPAETPDVDADDQEIFDELEAEGNTIANDPRGGKPAKPAPEKKADAPSDDDDGPDGPAPEKGEGKPEKPKPEDGKGKDGEGKPAKREPKTMFRYEHEIEVKRLEKEHNDEIARIKAEKGGDKPNPDKPADAPLKPEEADAEAKALAEELGMTVEQVEKFTALAAKRAGLSTELVDRLQALETATSADREARRQSDEDKAFNADFDSNVRTLIEEEYPGISAADLEEIRTTLKGYAYTDKYSQTPIELIYSGHKDFRAFTGQNKASGEGQGEGNKKGVKFLDLEKPMTEEEYDELSPEDQDKYDQAMESREHERLTG